MKIYNRKNFIWDLICLVVAAACGVTMAVQGFSWQLLISMVLMLAMGFGGIWLGPWTRPCRCPCIYYEKRM